MVTSRAMAWSVWMIASLFYAYQYILRVMPSIIMDDVVRHFHIDAAIFGQFSGVYYIGYALMHMPIGIMLDRYGPKVIMTSCMILAALGLVPIIMADHWVYPLIGRAVMGMGSSAAILGLFKIIRLTFKESHFTRMLSFSVTIGLMGAIYGGGPVSTLCHTWGYQVIVSSVIGLGIILASITYIIVPSVASVPRNTVLGDIRVVFTNHKVIGICCCAGLMVGALEGVADVWGAEFLVQVYGLDAQKASYLPSMIFVGMCFGSPLLSLIAEKTGSYLGVIAGSGIVMCIAFILLIAQVLTTTGITVSFIIVGVCCAYQILAIYQASTYVPEHVAGLTTAVANMIIMSFGYAFHSVIGLVIQYYGGINEPQAFVYGLSLIPTTLIAGVIGCVIIMRRNQDKSAYCKT